MPTVPASLLDSIPLPVISALLLGLMAVAFLGGRRMHVSLWGRSPREQASSHDYEGYIVSSVLGLLAILLGFTFSLSISRYEERRELVISQANAIGTAYLRAQLLGAPHRERLSHLLTGYTDNLIEMMSAEQSRIPALLAKDSGIVTELWAATAAANDSVRTIPLSIALMDSMNNLIDLDGARRSLFIIRIPTAVFIVLLIYHVGASGVLGYVLAEGRGRFAGGFVLILLSLALLLIMDIDRPVSGWVRTNTFPLLQARDSIRSQPPGVFDRWRN